MKAIVLSMAVMCLPQSLFATPPDNLRHTVNQVSICGEYTLVGSEEQRVCLTARSETGNRYSVSARRECMQGVGTCPAGPFPGIRSNCYAAGVGSNIVQVGNKNHFVVDLQPEDCDSMFGTPLGAQLIADANGRHFLTIEIERLWSRYRVGNQQCTSILGGGVQDSRSADVVATIDGWDVVIGDYIMTWYGEREVEHCSN